MYISNQYFKDVTARYVMPETVNSDQTGEGTVRLYEMMLFNDHESLVRSAKTDKEPAAEYSAIETSKNLCLEASVFNCSGSINGSERADLLIILMKTAL